MGLNGHRISIVVSAWVAACVQVLLCMCGCVVVFFHVPQMLTVKKKVFLCDGMGRWTVCPGD